MTRPKRVSDEEIIQVLRSQTVEPVMTTQEIAEQLPIGRRAVFDSLDGLHERGEVGKKKVGSRAVVWWVPKEGEWVSPGESAWTAKQATVETELKEPDWDAVDKVLNQTDKLSGRGEKLQVRREAIKASFRYLIEHQSAKASDFKKNVYPEHPAGYVEGEDPAQSWWKNNTYLGLGVLADAGLGVVRPDRSGKWVYAPSTAPKRDEDGRPTV